MHATIATLPTQHQDQAVKPAHRLGSSNPVSVRLAGTSGSFASSLCLGAALFVVR